MGEWEPDATSRIGEGEAFLWIVPARVEGRWALQDEGGFLAGEIELTQQFQRVGGTLTLRGVTQPLLGAYVDGENLGFTFVGSRRRRAQRARAGRRRHARGNAALRRQLHSCQPDAGGDTDPMPARHPLRPRTTEADDAASHPHDVRPTGARVRRPRARRARCRSRVHAQDYPARPVKVIVPFSPGGAVDGPMRVIAQELSKRMGQQVIVENKPGAGATIGTELVARAAPDGYTLLLASQTNAISATLYTRLAYDPIEDFAPISLIGREPGVLVVNPALPVKTLPGIRRLREGAAGPDRLRVVGQRQRTASVRRAARVGDGPQDESHSRTRAAVRRPPISWAAR